MNTRPTCSTITYIWLRTLAVHRHRAVLTVDEIVEDSRDLTGLSTVVVHERRRISTVANPSAESCGINRPARPRSVVESNDKVKLLFEESIPISVSFAKARNVRESSSMPTCEGWIFH
jgi:hypothetical protein